MLLHLKGSRTLAGTVLICAILGSALLVPSPATATSLTFTIITTPKGGSINFNLLTTFPITVGFSVKSSSPGATFLWQFGDGTNSTVAAPTHTYYSPCVYDAQVQVTASNGSVTSGGLVLGAFLASEKSYPGGALAVCTQQGTAGITPVELAGAYFPANKNVNVTMDGARIATVGADRGGDWVLNVSGFLAAVPEPNDTLYTFATSPTSPAAAFTTVEGVNATPSSGAPGDSVTVEGRSYPPNTFVLVYLDGVGLGSAQTDGNGSFQTVFSIPYSSPLTTAGTYPYETSPAILGSHASFTSTGATIVGTLLSSWWWWLLPIAIVVLVIAFLARRRRRREVPPEGDLSQDQGFTR